MIKRDFDELAQELLNVGFTEVYTLPLNDLKTGWIKKIEQFSRWSWQEGSLLKRVQF